MARETNPNFMNGVPELLILRLLEQEEMYGYEIVQAILKRTNSVIAVGEGVVYPVLHGLEVEGALKSRRKTVSGSQPDLLRHHAGRLPAAGQLDLGLEQPEQSNPRLLTRRCRP